jgi:predicted AAA+ superfamily ATPase
MTRLVELSERLIESVTLHIIRDQLKWLTRPDRLIGIKGARGAGKSTLLLQFARLNVQSKRRLYVSLDDIIFSEKKLTELADEFVKLGGEYLLLDEVHHYKNWPQEIKNIVDRYPSLHVIFTGSSILHLSKGASVLSRRAVVHDLPGLSFREYLKFARGCSFPVLSLEELLNNHIELAKPIWKKIKPLEAFNEYLVTGYYPYFIENPGTYDLKLRESLMKVLESDLPYVTQMEYANLDKIKQLLYIISQSVPFKPNIERLSEKMHVGKNTLKLYLKYLNDASIINTLYSSKKGVTLLTKPEKIYLHHPNLMSCLAADKVEVGNMRESFFLNQVKYLHPVQYPEQADFLVNNKWLFETGGKNKGKNQIQGHVNAFLALDGIETGFGNTIPLWLFGFLY